MICYASAAIVLLSTHADRQNVDRLIIIDYCLFVCLYVCVCVSVCLCVCTVTDFSAEDNASGVKFCTAVHQRPRQGISHFEDLCSPRPKIGRIGQPPGSEVQGVKTHLKRHAIDSPLVGYRAACGRRIGMCG